MIEYTSQEDVERIYEVRGNVSSYTYLGEDLCTYNRRKEEAGSRADLNTTFTI